MTTNDKEYSELYGPLATISEYKRGETVTYHDYAQPSGRNSGQIIWIVAATDLTYLTYIVTPIIGRFPVPISAHEIIE